MINEKLIIKQIVTVIYFNLLIILKILHDEEKILKRVKKSTKTVYFVDFLIIYFFIEPVSSKRRCISNALSKRIGVCPPFFTASL